MIRLGVLGWPVAHSRSPAVHNAALAAAGLGDEWVYQLLPVPPELFAETVRALPAAGFTGANVTIPYKEAALGLAGEATDRARQIGAANTLTFDGAIHADNTDAPGLIAALPEPPAGATALVLGAGGSARAVVWALRDAGAADVMVWNRTPERAEHLVADLGGRPVTGAPEADLLVNCTAAGLDGEADPFRHLPLGADEVARYPAVVDLVYGSRDTALIAAARRHGVAAVDGLEVLVRQGALAFARWTGVDPSLPAMWSAARP
jgi:shikimate dehydrogenase